MKPFTGNMSGRIYYAKRVGLRWQAWYAYQDGEADPHNGATEWCACSVKFWRWMNAERTAQEMWCAFNDGVWCESGRNNIITSAARRFIASHESTEQEK